MFDLLKSAAELVDDVVTIVSTPLRVAVDGARQVTKPIAEAAKEIVTDPADKQ